MKNSSADPVVPADHGAPSVTPNHGAPSVTPARMDRPLRTFGGRWVDPDAEHRIGQAAEVAREQARAQGYAAGWAQGRQAAAAAAAQQQQRHADDDARQAQQQAARFDSVLVALTRAASSADVAAAPRWSELADVLADGALAIARAALGRELASIDDPTVAAVRSALAILGEPDEVVIRANASDLALLTSVANRAKEAGNGAAAKVSFVVDAALAPGDVTLATVSQRLRLHLPAAVAAAEAVLRT
jgi:flagellar assembly protein FliH